MLDHHRKSEFGIDAFDSSIRVECANSEIRDALDRYLFPTLPRSRSILGPPDVSLAVDSIDSRFRVSIDHQVAAFADTIHDAVRAAVKGIDDVLIHRITSYRAVHAAAVLIQGRALLIPGSTHAGKSSLAAELLRRGATHFSDEYALIDERGFVHSYPRPLLIRSGGHLQSLVLPQELNSSFVTQPSRVGWVVAVEYVPDGAWSIGEISQAEAVMLLLRNTPHEMTQSPQMVDFFRSVVSEAACYQGTRGEVAEAAGHILNMTCPK